MDLNDAFNIVVNKVKSECDASNGRCDRCRLHDVCYIKSTDENRFLDFPHEIIEMMRDALNKDNIV